MGGGDLTEEMRWDVITNTYITGWGMGLSYSMGVNRGHRVSTLKYRMYIIKPMFPFSSCSFNLMHERYTDWFIVRMQACTVEELRM